MHSGWIIPDGVLPTKEDARRVLDHVVALARVAGDDGGGEDVVVVATCASRDKAVTAPLESKSWEKKTKADKNFTRILCVRHTKNMATCSKDQLSTW